jgi:cytochrome c-type biogenesis protein CcmF
VGAPFFQLTFVPLMIPLLLAVPFGPLLGWKRGDLTAAAQRLGVAMAASLVAAAVTYVGAGGKGVLAPFGVALGVWLVAGSLVDLAERSRLFRINARESLARLWGLPRSALGTSFAHAGVGLCVIGLVSASAHQSETIAALKPGETAEVAGYTLLFEGAAPASGPNYTEERARFAVTRGGMHQFALAPAKRFYPTRQMTTTEAAIETVGLSQLYVSLGDRLENGSIAVHAYYKPLVTLIWLGAIVAALGGALSLSDRRLRVGAPRRAAARQAAAAAT